MKLIDFDGLFDKKLTQFLKENRGKYTERQWENLIPKLYKKFGETFIPKLGDTPEGYFRQKSGAELVSLLKAYVEEGVPVPDFLCREIEERNVGEEFLPLFSSDNEELLTLIINLAGANPALFDAYFAILKGNYDKELKDTACDQLKANADEAKERALDFLKAGVEEELMLEILSRCKTRDERVYSALLKAFSEGDDMSMHASYLAAYGDERALETLLACIDRDDINYLEYRELKYAIEALGGSYEKERDFSDDPYFQELLSESQLPPDFPFPPKN